MLLTVSAASDLGNLETIDARGSCHLATTSDTFSRTLLSGPAGYGSVRYAAYPRLPMGMDWVAFGGPRWNLDVTSERAALIEGV